MLDAEGRATEGEDVFALLGDLKASFDAGKYPIFAAEDGRVVIPVTGSGLWGPVWGYVALEKDMNTVAGIVLDHKGETPGLGAEIATPKFQSYFVGKKIFEGDEFVSVALRKGGASAERIDHEVDAIGRHEDLGRCDGHAPQQPVALSALSRSASCGRGRGRSVQRRNSRQQ